MNRQTKETEIELKLNIDGSGKNKISTGIDFFDHMLTSFSVHSGFDIELKVKGDLKVDCHHTVEDTGIVLGQALNFALADKRGITRFGSCFIPMDETLSFCAADVCGRAFLVFDAEFKRQFAGDLETATVEEFFRAFAVNANITLHIKNYYGTNDHHKIESMFKAMARTLKAAVKAEGDIIPSSKGKL
ncbi:MAG: imidazoleglycerol-phosphate dehydratase HisB [Firmicutes bacterium]|nr:imidazoleglycerol-phosphate dehydratase HisB [Bacillota bacterium]